MTVNDIYLDYLFPCKDRYIFLFGGAGSGKSHAGMQKIITRLETEDAHRFLALRKLNNRVEESIFNKAMTIIKNEIGSYNEYSTTKKPFKISHCDGSEMLMNGLDDQEKIKSIEGITSVFIEEITEFTEEDYIQIKLRMRGETDTYHQIISCFNPVDKDHWLLKYVEPQLLDNGLPDYIVDLEYLVPGKVWRFGTLDNEGDVTYTTVINTTHEDNHMITKEYRKELKGLSNISENHSTVYLSGRWGTRDKGDLFVPSFKRSVHVCDVNFLDDYPIHYTCDFNTKPYMTGILCQYIPHVEYDEIRVFKEYALAYPNNNSHALGETIATEYEDHMWSTTSYIYGDASGNNKLGIKNVTSLFSDLKSGLGNLRNRCKFRVPKSNPRYGNEMSKNFLARRLLLDKAFEGAMVNGRKVKIIIDKSCKNLIGDLEYCKQDANGRLEKKKNKDGIEERGHMIDAFTYFTHHNTILGKYRKLR